MPVTGHRSFLLVLFPWFFAEEPRVSASDHPLQNFLKRDRRLHGPQRYAGGWAFVMMGRWGEFSIQNSVVHPLFLTVTIPVSKNGLEKQFLI